MGVIQRLVRKGMKTSDFNRHRKHEGNANVGDESQACPRNCAAWGAGIAECRHGHWVDCNDSASQNCSRLVFPSAPLNKLFPPFTWMRSCFSFLEKTKGKQHRGLSRETQKPPYIALQDRWASMPAAGCGWVYAVVTGANRGACVGHRDMDQSRSHRVQFGMTADHSWLPHLAETWTRAATLSLGRRGLIIIFTAATSQPWGTVCLECGRGSPKSWACGEALISGCSSAKFLHQSCFN